MARDTRQRRALRTVFEQADRPLSIDEVWAGVRALEPRIALATIYRNVRGLVQEGELSQVHFPGRASRYELEGKAHHHHFECRICNRAFELTGCGDEVRFKVPRGFKVQGHEIIVYGRCPSCAAR